MSPAYEFYVPTFRSTLFHLHRWRKQKESSFCLLLPVSFSGKCPRRMNFMCRRFGAHCSILTGGASRKKILSACSCPSVLVASVVQLDWNLMVKKRVETDTAWQASMVNKHGITDIQRYKTWRDYCVFDETKRNELRCEDIFYYNRGLVHSEILLLRSPSLICSFRSFLRAVLMVEFILICKKVA